MEGYSVKTYVDKVSELAMMIFEKGGAPLESDRGIRVEIALFLMYLATADDEIDWDEMREIGYDCGIEITKWNIDEYLAGGGVKSGKYGSSVPYTFQLMVEADKALSGTETDLNCAESMLDIYRFLADSSINKAKIVNSQRITRAKDYLGMIERYWVNNRPCKASMSHKEMMQTIIASKKGVAAPKKC